MIVLVDSLHKEIDFCIDQTGYDFVRDISSVFEPNDIPVSRFVTSKFLTSKFHQ